MTKTDLIDGFCAFVTLAVDMSTAISKGTYTADGLAARERISERFIDELRRSDDEQMRLVAVKMTEILTEMRKLIGCNGRHARRWKRIEASVKRKAAVFDRLATEITMR